MVINEVQDQFKSFKVAFLESDIFSYLQNQHHKNDVYIRSLHIDILKRAISIQVNETILVYLKDVKLVTTSNLNFKI